MQQQQQQARGGLGNYVACAFRKACACVGVDEPYSWNNAVACICGKWIRGGLLACTIMCLQAGGFKSKYEICW
jgi:hypothetical protein